MYEERQRELGLLSLENRRLGRTLSVCENTCWEGAKVTELFLVVPGERIKSNGAINETQEIPN